MDFARCIALENSRVRLRPLELTDFEDLKAVAFDPEVWRFLTTPMPRNSVDLAAYLAQAVRDREAGKRYPFAIIDKESGRVVGSTSYGNIALDDKRLEIGWTWLGSEYQRTGINRAAKHLLLKYAFGELGCERVELKTDARNWKSREAMRRMGATEEGTLRSHCLTQGGLRRDSVYFSILKSEWDQLCHTVFQQFDARG
ncbi:Protein N-acetyltransferase, RimJ/RimL family [Hymenobacter gelipurpurascens]|uniref:Protein N-acetyltransferase, RimJ/RimL family n=1 Tax=Hymenobacter gelipurpurascens TaxID=89968 RepID=A0A212UF38_9BACT|nr:GNAT family protein [Hymenobacter gelipurpurascens]SNC76793.1 Protein N-acetyltransferase, RimJ/RimL family [Hymenobacter gelipurpurascens]